MELTVRSTRTEDAHAWHALWRAYCAALDGAVSDEATARVRDTLLASGDLKTSAPPAAYVDRRFMAVAPRSGEAR